MRFVIITIGTAGDVFPLLGIGRELLSRGHTVTFASLEQYRQIGQRAGLPFTPIEGVSGASGHADFYHPTRGMEVVARGVLVPALRPVYNIASRDADEGVTIIADPFCYGARIAQDLRQFPMITCVVSPFILRSIDRMPVTPGVAPPQWAPAVLKRAFFGFVSRLWDRQLGPAVNGFRQELGLAPVRDIFYSWSLSPDRVVGLFPEWFAPRASDWPAQFVHGGFTVFDQSGGAEEIPPVLHARERPLVAFAAGSAGIAAAPFFNACIEASRGRAWQGIVLAPGLSPPANLPENVVCCPFLPMSKLLPLTSAVVFHGGLGTMALALAAGVPQIVVPFGHDQHDNAARVERLHVARSIKQGASVTPQTLAAVIESVLRDNTLRQNARALAPKADMRQAVATTCDHIEESARSGRAGARVTRR